MCRALAKEGLLHFLDPWYQPNHSKLNPLPNDKILASTKLRGFADDKIKVTQKLKFVLRGIENIVGKTSISSFSHYIFKRFLIQVRYKTGFCGKELKINHRHFLTVDLIMRTCSLDLQCISQ